jgi:two-component system, OmpR family, KDP operon response regulator KdpE
MRLSTAFATILIVADDPRVRRALCTTLSSQGCLMGEAKSSAEALVKLRNDRPDLILLHLMSGPMDLACREIRSASDVPIIVLISSDTELEKVTALDAGADDCVVTPFCVQELLARVRALLRRAGFTENPRTFESGGLRIDFDQRTVSVRGTTIRLTPKEFELLRILVANRGKPLRHRRLLQAIWGSNYGDERQYLRVFISQLRKKIEPDPSRPVFICTHPWVGYRFEQPPPRMIE